MDILLTINEVDYTRLVSKLKIEFNVLVSEDSGRNALGDTTVDIINRKAKINATFRPMDEDAMSALLNAVEPYVLTVRFRDPHTKSLKTITAYTSVPSPEYMWNLENNTYMYSMSLNFIEL